MPNGKSKFVPRDLIVAFRLLLRLLNNKLFHTSFVHKNCPGQFLFSILRNSRLESDVFLFKLP